MNRKCRFCWFVSMLLALTLMGIGYTFVVKGNVEPLADGRTVQQTVKVDPFATLVGPGLATKRNGQASRKHLLLKCAQVFTDHLCFLPCPCRGSWLAMADTASFVRVPLLLDATFGTSRRFSGQCLQRDPCGNPWTLYHRALP